MVLTISPWIFIFLIALFALVILLRDYRFRRWVTVKTLLLRRNAIDADRLDELVRVAGYAYDRKQDIFYTRLDSWQRGMGYCRLYDEAAILSTMIIDCEPIYFEYDGKRWLIEFWKGQYGMCTGCEVGVFNTENYDWDLGDLFKGTFYQAAGNRDLLNIRCSLKKKGKRLFTRQEKHWWLTGFILGEFSEPADLVMDIRITLKDETMTNAFIQGLREAGYSDQEINVSSNTVNLRFAEPRTPQPIARTPVTDWVAQRKNKILCEKYQEITAGYDTAPEKLSALLEKAPDMFEDIVDHIGRKSKSYEDYWKLQRHVMEPSFRSNKRLSQVFDSAEEIPFDDSSKFIIMSDVHRGNGSWADDFARNRNLYIAALNYYYRNNFTYIELGDGDELWENKHLSDIINVHRDVFRLLSKFHRSKRLYLVFGNHDMAKKSESFVRDNLFQYFDQRSRSYVPLFENVKCHEGLILRHTKTGNKIFLTHGHQVDFWGYTMWKAARFLSRYLWRPLNLFGVNDPTCAAKNYRKKEKVEKRLIQWVRKEKQILISGHTHRPMLPEPGEPPYFNAGSSVHPQDITGIEIEGGNITLIKWNVTTNNSGQLIIKREIIAWPKKLEDYY